MASTQADWRFCSKCFSLWFNGQPTNGVCAAGGEHTDRESNAGASTPPETPQGGPTSGNYILPFIHTGTNTQSTQDNWRFCSKCFSLWFNGQPTNGVCAAGGVHTDRESNAGASTPPETPQGGPTSGNYILPFIHTGKNIQSTQDNWRFCSKCFSLWFNGQPTNGVCAAGGVHTDVASTAGASTPLEAPQGGPTSGNYILPLVF
ncbi:hypothetical protein EDE15_4226 [Edaphobacter aggregans]|uniref:Uncharacterized protein n=1 Tax=Edaphobacter aggregans TaxID=570835 RepID=A0A428MP66_9BACT|nr:hypothetical protein EDE15_4226 [Edaphobacter aggregans]